MTNLTAKDVEVLTHLLTGEEMACKKARIYANTLMDTALAATRRSTKKTPCRTCSTRKNCS